MIVPIIILLGMMMKHVTVPILKFHLTQIMIGVKKYLFGSKEGNYE